MFKVKRLHKIYYVKNNHNKEVAMLILDKIELQKRNIVKNKAEHFIIIKESTLTTINTYNYKHI